MRETPNSGLSPESCPERSRRNWGGLVLHGVRGLGVGVINSSISINLPKKIYRLGITYGCS